MAENVKKFLDYEGLKTYNTNIKKYAKDQASGVETTIRGEFKVKNIDKTDNGKVALTLSETGVLGVTVGANVVVDSNYNTVAANANNSAAAWGKFLEGTLDSATNPAPKLSELATTADVTSAIATAKSEAITEAGKLDEALETKITTAYQGADDAVKSTLIGAKGNASDADTIYGAKKYADEKAADAKAAADTAKAAAAAAQSTDDAAKAAAKVADDKAVAAQGTADTLKNTTIPALKTALEGKISDNTNLINSTKDELIGTDGQDGTTIYGAKKYAKDLTDNITKRIDSIVSGGVAFKGVVTEMPSNPQNGDLVIIGKEGGITVGNITYKKDYEYIYSNGTWYELGDSDKNAKAIAVVDAKADTNKELIDTMDAAYKAADTILSQSIENINKAAVKSITGDNSNYVTISVGVKDDTGNITLSVFDSIADTFDKKADVDSKITNAKTEVSNALIGKDNDGAGVNTIWGAKAYAKNLVETLENSFVAITAEEINGLFTI